MPPASRAAGRSPCSSPPTASRSGAAPTSPRPPATAAPPSSTSCAKSPAIYRDEPDTIATNAAALMAHLAAARTGPGIALDRALLDQAADAPPRLHGPGARRHPRRPEIPPGRASSISSGAPPGAPATRAYRDIVLTTLRNICQGGIYDHIGGGFARYSTDARWLVPHFEKMLYDNAQLIALLAAAWRATGEPLFRTRIEETSPGSSARCCCPGGAFAASIDADSEGHEGRFYVWTRDEVIAVLGEGEGTFFADTYDITERGNWEGVSSPTACARPGPRATPTSAASPPPAQRSSRHRAGRVRPATDDKILADWNGLAIAALASAGTAFDRPDWIDLADRRLPLRHRHHDARRPPRPFLARRQIRLPRPRHRLRRHDQGRPRPPRRHLRSRLARPTPSPRRHPPRATTGTPTAPATSSPPTTPRRSSSARAPIPTRPRPSAASLMAANLIRLWRLTGNDAYRADADAILEAASPRHRRQPLRHHRPPQRPRPPPRRHRRGHRPARYVAG